MRQQEIHFEHDVIIGECDHLFLAQGGHRVYDIATGIIQPLPVSLANFQHNLIKRKQNATALGASYFHLIFPDKQTILNEYYIVKNPVSLGNIFYTASKDLGAELIFPYKLLKSLDKRAYLHCDTHLTDEANIEATSHLVEILTQESQTEHRSLLLSKIELEREHSGDLGSRFSPIKSHSERFLRTFWPRTLFQNELHGNNGLVDIWFSPSAPYTARVLWFGDSFGRQTVALLSYFFKEIMFLRTPFVHDEIANAFSPDIIISNNVERYFSFCEVDELRPWFSSYPYLGGKEYRPSQEFARVYSSILSYPRSPYQTLRKKYVMENPKEAATAPENIKHVEGTEAESQINMIQANSNNNANVPNGPSTTVDILQMPASGQLYAQNNGISDKIHVDDLIYKYVERRAGGNVERGVLSYFELGSYSSKLIAEILKDVTAVKTKLGEKWDPVDLLDFASGYGNTARWLKSRLPKMNISTCDIHAQAVEFNTNVLGVKSYLSSRIPEDVILPKSDAIFCLSFFSHMPEATFGRWLKALSRHLNPGGVLVFTANGYVTHKLNLLLIEPDERGFGFRPASEQKDLDPGDYGVTIAYPKYVFKLMDEIDDLRLMRFQSGFWWGTQDLYIYCKNDTA
ncbi:MAG: hypothetical protein C5B44_06885 [Acidobacteria bacterium]|nr:MAG: hypothetical protein C5B44_06885 [Acidobacteriota bacterium]